MAIGWMKSLHCNSKALDDVVHHHHRPSTSASSSSSSSSTCRSGLKDVLRDTTSRRSKPPPQDPISSTPSKSHPKIITRFAARSSSLSPSLAELPEGHPSRNVVEIIFRSGWGEKDFPGRVEMVFKVKNLTRTVARFEEYREDVKSRAGVGGGGEDHARCVADGNEMMRFYCLGASGGAYDGWGLQCGKGAGVCTYSGSGVAHEKGGGGRGRRAMLVCRVVAGRLCKDGGIGYDSVSGENGELYVFDARAVLPCFLIIYNKLY